MNSAAFLPIAALTVLWIWMVVQLVYLEPRGKLTSVTLLPYQRGVLFQKGLPVRDVGPGKHRVWAGSELLVHGDTRPITVNYEKQVVALNDGFLALYGFSASVEVRDIRKAIYSARNYTEVPPSVLLRCTRRQLNACSGKSLNLDKDTVVNRITEDAKARLGKAGFNLVSYRITQLAIGVPQAPAAQLVPRPNPTTS
jgi:SPFH domain/Band 7 family protein